MSRSSADCALNGTVVASVLTGSIESIMPLAASVAAAGFRCLVVQPFDTPLSSVPPQLMLLPPPTPPLLPRSRFCNGSQYTARRAQLHRMHLWNHLLGQGLHVFSVASSARLLRTPLPAIAALRTRDGSEELPDVIGSTPGWFMKHYYLSSTMYIRATNETRALLQAALPRVRGAHDDVDRRAYMHAGMHAPMHAYVHVHTYVHTRGAHEDVVFSEELNFGAGRHATCCHTECLAKHVVTLGPISPGKSARPPSSAADATPPPLLDSRTETVRQSACACMRMHVYAHACTCMHVYAHVYALSHRDGPSVSM